MCRTTWGIPRPWGIIDETAFLKKGTHSAGVARQYSGTAGRVENCQVGVFLAYAGARGYTLLDAELYLPKGWTDKPARLQAVGLAPDTPLATKPQLAQRLLARAQAAGVSLAWVVGDTVYGHSGKLRSWLEARDQAYLLAVPAHENFLVGWYEVVVGEVFAVLAEEDWQRLSAGPGSKGERWYDWQCLVLAEGARRGQGPLPAVPAQLCAAGAVAGLSCVGLPGLRRAHPGPDCRQSLAHRVGLRDGQAGSGPGRVRGAQRPGLGPPHDPGPVGPGPAQRGAGRLPGPAGPPKKVRGTGQPDGFPTGPRPGRGLTVPEIRRLWRRLLQPVVADLEQVLAWSHWRRCHQWVALHCHYRRQQATTL